MATLGNECARDADAAGAGITLGQPLIKLIRSSPVSSTPIFPYNVHDKFSFQNNSYLFLPVPAYFPHKNFSPAPGSLLFPCFLFLVFLPPYNPWDSLQLYCGQIRSLTRTHPPHNLIENHDPCGWVFIYSNKRETQVAGSYCKRHQGTEEMGWERGDFGLRKTSIKRDLSAFKYMKCYCVYNADSLLSTPLRRGQRREGLQGDLPADRKNFLRLKVLSHWNVKGEV